MRKPDPYCAFDESWEPAGEKYQPRSFSSWNEVSKWMNNVMDPQAVPSEPLAAKARDLVSNHHKEFDRIEAIGRYVQGLSAKICPNSRVLIATSHASTPTLRSIVRRRLALSLQSP